MGGMVQRRTATARNGRRTDRPELQSDRGDGHKTPLASSPEPRPAPKHHFHSSHFSQPHLTAFTNEELLCLHPQQSRTISASTAKRSENACFRVFRPFMLRTLQYGR